MSQERPSSLSGVSTSVMTFQQLDKLLRATTQALQTRPAKRKLKKRTKAKPAKMPVSVRNEGDMEQLLGVLSRVRTVKARMAAFKVFKAFLTNPFASINGPAPTFGLMVSSIAKVFRFFRAQSHKELLRWLADLPVAVALNSTFETPEKQIEAYEQAIKACCSVLKRCKTGLVSYQLVAMFAKKVLANAVEMSLHMSLPKSLEVEAEKGKKKRKKLQSAVDSVPLPDSRQLVYIGCVLPFVAELHRVRGMKNAELVKLLHQFWVVVDLFSNFVPGAFARWADSMEVVVKVVPPLFEKGPKIDLGPVKPRVKDVVDSIVGEGDRELVGQKIEQLLPAVPPKVLEGIDIVDAVYALAIYDLEMARADRGIIQYMFDYIESKCSKEFSVILVNILSHVLQLFQKCIKTTANVELRNKMVGETLLILADKLFSPVAGVFKLAEQSIDVIAKEGYVAVCYHQFFDKLLDNLVNLADMKASDKRRITKLVQGLMCKASECPHAFFAVVFDVCSKKVGPSTQLVVDWLKYFPDNDPLKDTILAMYLETAGKLAQVPYMTPEQKRRLSCADRLRITAFDIIHSSNVQLIDSLFISDAEPSWLLYAWSHVAMASTKLSMEIIGKCISTFLRGARDRKGVFGKVKDLRSIRYQKTLLTFLIEQLILKRYSIDLVAILSVAFEADFLHDAAVVPVLLSYAYLTGVMLSSGVVICKKLVYTMKQFMIRTCLTVVSFTDDGSLLRYIAADDLLFLNRVIELLPMSENDEKSTVSWAKFRTSPHGMVSNSLTKASEASTNKVSKLVEDEAAILPDVVAVVRWLLSNQLQFFSCFVLHSTSATRSKPIQVRIEELDGESLDRAVPYIWDIAPQVLYQFTQMKKLIAKKVAIPLQQLEFGSVFTAASVPSFALLFARLSPHVKCKRWRKLVQEPKWFELRERGLPIWKPLPAIKALALLRPEIMSSSNAAQYVTKCFSHFTESESLLFLPQLVQSLRFDVQKVLQRFLINHCKESEIFCHYLLWNIASEKGNKVSSDDNLPEILCNMEQQIVANMNQRELKNKNNEFGFVKAINHISEELLGLRVDMRPNRLIDRLKELKLTSGLYIPTHPHYKIVSIDAEHSVPLKSHARVPVLIQFKVYNQRDRKRKQFPFSCIFKIADDVRQDAMVIQFIDTFKRIFDDAGLDIWMLPYRVFATGDNEGIIECIQNAHSRHDLGRTSEEPLLDYFKSKYGQVNTSAFQKAQANFVKSMAPYSLLCYLFQVKDRHNANIMIDNEGHIIHIDFGFIFEISPGGNMNFERAPFRLTREMIDLMGGSDRARPFIQFRNLLIQCFLAVRTRHEELESIAALMMHAGFPCFTSNSIKRLQQRFFLKHDIPKVVDEIDGLIKSAYEATSTTLYDSFQMASNEIYF